MSKPIHIPEHAIISRLYLWEPRNLTASIQWMEAITAMCPDARIKNEGPLVVAAFDPAKVPEWKED